MTVTWGSGVTWGSAVTWGDVRSSTQTQTVSNGVTAGNSVTTTFPLAPVAGHLLVAVVASGSTGAGTIAPPSGWQQAVESERGAAGTVGIYYRIADGTEQSVTANATVSTRLDLYLLEYANTANPPLDVTATNFVAAGGSTNALSSGAAPSTGHDNIFAIAAWSMSGNHGGVTGYSNGYSQVAQRPQSAVARQSYALHQSAESTASWANSVGAASAVAVFRGGFALTTLQAVATINTPIVSATHAATVAPSTLAAFATINTPIVRTSGVQLTTLQAVGTINTPTISVDTTVYPTTLSAEATINTPNPIVTSDELLFEPPVVQTVPAIYLTGNDASHPVPALSQRLFAHYKPRDRGVNVFVLKDGTVTTKRPWDEEVIDEVFWGGHIAKVSAFIAALLRRAGFFVRGGVHDTPPPVMPVTPSPLVAEATINTPTVTAETSVVVRPVTITGVGTINTPHVTASPHVTVMPSQLQAVATINTPSVSVSAQTPSILPYAPPALSAPITIKITNASPKAVGLDYTKDYIILLPQARGNDVQASAPLQAIGGFELQGGRNITIIGGVIAHNVDYVATNATTRPAGQSMRAMLLSDWKGSLHVEGVEIKGTNLYCGIQIDNRNAAANLTIENLRVSDPVLAAVYADGSIEGGVALQDYAGPRGTYRVHKFSAPQCANQGLYHEPLQQDSSAAPTTVSFEKINIGPYTGTRAFPSWPGKTFASGGFRSGTNFVYVKQTAPSVPPTPTPTPTPQPTTPVWYANGFQPAGITLDEIVSIFNAKYALWKQFCVTQTGMPSGMPAGAWRVSVPDAASSGQYPVNGTYSEGMGYGMVVTAYTSRVGSPIYDPQAADIFDGLWKYYKFFRNGNGLMNWRITPTGQVGDNGQNGATDGDQDAALGLLIRSRTGGSYATDRDALANAILSTEFTPTSFTPPNLMQNGDGWGPYDNVYMPDYWNPAWVREEGTITSNSRWTDVLNANYPLATDYFYNHFPTGYVPDACLRDGTTTNGRYPYSYGYNSIRMPWRLSLDYLWNGETKAQRMLAKLANAERTRAGGVPANARAVRDLNGNLTVNPSNGQLNDYINRAFLSGFGVAGVADSAATTWTKDCIRWLQNSDEANYFGKNLEILALLILTGEAKPYR